MVFDPARSNLSQPLRLHYAIAALPKTAFLILLPFLHKLGGAARLIISRLPFVRQCLSWVKMRADVFRSTAESVLNSDIAP
jgi:hypothetical protein